MGRTPGELESTLTTREWRELIALHSIDPWTEDRADLRSAIIAKQVVDVNIPRGKPRSKLKDFMPFRVETGVEKPEGFLRSQLRTIRERLPKKG